MLATVGFKLLISAAVMLFLVHHINVGEIALTLRQANPLFIWGAFALGVPNVLLQYIKWHILLSTEKRNIARRDIWGSLFAGMTLGLITPGRIGEFGRALFIERANRLRVLGLTMIDKTLAIFIIYFYGVWGFMFWESQFDQFSATLPLNFAIPLLIAIAFLVWKRQGWLKKSAKKWMPLKWHYRLSDLFTYSRTLSLQTVMKVSLLAALQSLTYFIQFYLLVRAFSDVALLTGLAAIASIMMAKSFLPLSFGDLGVRESAAIFFLAPLMVPKAAAFNASMILFFINILLPSLIGIVFILQRQVQVQRAAQMSP